MAAPPKPWERGSLGLGNGSTQGLVVGRNQRHASFTPGQFNSFSATQDIGSGDRVIGGGGGGGTYLSGRPPALPPRRTTSAVNTVSRPFYGGPSSYSSYGGYGGSPYGGYGSYGTYGGYGGYNRYGMMGNGPPEENGFMQVAEESSRQAFQSIESIVHAFGSVSMMLESTYHAVYSSFRAVLGVAEHFSRMKSQFAQIFSALAVVRTLRWILRKLLYLIGLRSQDPSLEAVWHAAANGAASSTSSLTEADLKASRSSWPIVMFLGVVFGGPYLIWRLLSSLMPPSTSKKSHGWKRGVSEHYAAVASYNFEAENKKELSFQSGQRLFLAPKDCQPQGIRGWLLASDGTHVGLVPANYIKILGLRQGSPQAVNNMPCPVSDSSGYTSNGRVAPRIPSMTMMKQAEQYPSSSSVDTSLPANSRSTMNLDPSNINVSTIPEQETKGQDTQSMESNVSVSAILEQEIMGQETPQSMNTPTEEIAFPSQYSKEVKPDPGLKRSLEGESSDSSYEEISHENIRELEDKKDSNV